MESLVPALLVCALAAGCTARPAPRDLPPEPLAVTLPPPAPAARLLPRPGAGDAVVARVGGAEIRRSDLGDFMIRFFRDQASEALTQLVDERIIEEEVRREGIDLPPGAVEEAVRAELDRRANEVKVQFGRRVGLEEFLRDRYGTTLEEHRRDLARLLRVRLLRDRVVRFSQLGQDRVEARDAVFANPALARRAAEGARAGADLGRLAREEGLGEEVLPPSPKDELTPPALAEAVFALAPGAVSEPIAVLDGDERKYHVFKVLRRLPARDLTWPEARDEVEAGLRERPLERYEYLTWARQVRERYQVEVLR